MSREILFKAKRTDNGEWVEGALFDSEDYCVIGQQIKFSPYTKNECKIAGYTVDKTTICQYTGLTDKNGKKIWENDIVEIPKEDGYFKAEWEEDTARWIMDNKSERYIVDFDNYWSYEVEVVSNIFDNPELLEVKE